LYISSICSLLAAAIAADADQDDDENNSSNDSNNNIFKHVVADVYLFFLSSMLLECNYNIERKKKKWQMTWR
jgi:cAMP phosphodiesterase